MAATASVPHRRIEFLIYMAAALMLSVTPYIHRPLGWFETLFHESSHGLAAVLTGGHVDRLLLNIDGSGLLWSAGGFRPLVSFAGYAGAIAWGSLLYLAATAASARAARNIALGLLGAGILESLFWLAWNPETLGIMAVILATFATMLHRRIASFVRPLLRLVGAYVLVSGLRSPTYVLEAGGQHNDAESLSSMLLMPQWFWVGCWCAMGMGAIIAVYRIERGHDRRRATVIAAAV